MRIIIATLFLAAIGAGMLASFPVYAVECAPGDIPIDINGKAIVDSNGLPVPPGTDGVADCLYGSGAVSRTVFGRPVQDVRSNIRIALNVLFGFLSIIVIIMVLYGGVTWLTAMGQEEKVTRGRDTLIWAAIGAVVIAVAWTITSFIIHSANVIKA